MTKTIILLFDLSLFELLSLLVIFLHFNIIIIVSNVIDTS